MKNTTTCDLLFCLLLVGKIGHIGTLGHLPALIVLSPLIVDVVMDFAKALAMDLQWDIRARQWWEQKKAERRVAKIARIIKKEAHKQA